MEVEKEASFRVGRSTMANVFNLIQVNEKRMARNKETLALCRFHKSMIVNQL